MYDFEQRIMCRMKRLEQTVRQLTVMLLVTIICLFAMALVIYIRFL